MLEKLKSVHQVSQLERVQTLLPDFHTFKVQDGSIDVSASKLTQLQLEIAAADQARRVMSRMNIGPYKGSHMGRYCNRKINHVRRKQRGAYIIKACLHKQHDH